MISDDDIVKRAQLNAAGYLDGLRSCEHRGLGQDYNDGFEEGLVHLSDEMEAALYPVAVEVK